MAVRSRLGAAARAITAGLDPAVRAAADDGKAVRDRLAPVDTGALKASGRVVKVAPAHYQIREGAGLPDARAIYTEYGTARQRAQPHMTPAAEHIRRSAPAQIAGLLRVSVRKA